MSYKITDSFQIGDITVLNSAGEIVSAKVRDANTVYHSALITTTLGANRTYTLSDNTGTIALLADIKDGTLGAGATGTAPTNTAVSLSFSGTYSANTSNNVTISANVGPAVSNLVATMGNANLGLLRKSAADTYVIDEMVLIYPTGANIAGYANVLGNLYAGNIETAGDLRAGNTIITGNLTVTGTVEYTNVTTLAITDPIIELGGGANGATPLLDDGKDRGSLLRYYSGTAKDAFMGWDNSNAEFAFGSMVTMTNDVVTFTSLGNVRVGNLLGANLVSANYVTGTLTTAAQPNITSVGSLSSLTVIGDIGANNITATSNVNAGNASLGNLATANYFSGNGYLLSNVVGVIANTLANGNSNVIVSANSNVDISSSGNANIFRVTGTGANVFGYLWANGTIRFTNTTDSTDSSTGAVILTGGLAVNKNISLSGGIIQSNTGGTLISKIDSSQVVIAAGVANTVQVVDQWPVATYRSAKYLIQMTQGANYQLSEVFLLHNGSTASSTEYGMLENNGWIGTITTDLDSGNVRILSQMVANVATTINFTRTLIQL